MKTILFLILFSLSSNATAEPIKKWVDEAGKVHYGNTKSEKYIDSAETLKIRDTYDQKAYEEGLKRHKETEILGQQYEKERLADEKEKKEIEEKEKAIKERKSAQRAPHGSAVLAYPRRPSPRQKKPEPRPGVQTLQ